jgi:hypothetical protein
MSTQRHEVRQAAEAAVRPVLHRDAPLRVIRNMLRTGTWRRESLCEKPDSFGRRRRALKVRLDRGFIRGIYAEAFGTRRSHSVGTPSIAHGVAFFGFPHLAAAAFCAISRRRAGDSFSARALALAKPAFRPISLCRSAGNFLARARPPRAAIDCMCSLTVISAAGFFRFTLNSLTCNCILLIDMPLYVEHNRADQQMAASYRMIPRQTTATLSPA